MKNSKIHVIYPQYKKLKSPVIQPKYEKTQKIISWNLTHLSDRDHVIKTIT